MLSISRLIDISGIKFGRLTAIDYESDTRKWNCLCECGNKVKVLMQNLKRGKQKSCGCFDLERKTKHGQTGTGYKSSVYRTWQNMKKRCFYKDDRFYHHYGGRGITVCDRWLHSFENFYADMGDKPSPRHSLDRIDVNGNYEPSNCRWATYSEQVINQRKRSDNTSGHKGISKCNKSGKWHAYFKPNKETKRINVGYFNDLEEAILARTEAKKQYK